MERMTLSTKNAGVLHHKLYTCVEGKNHHLCPIAHHGVVWWGACVVEWKHWCAWEVRRVNPIWLAKEVSLKKSSSGRVKDTLFTAAANFVPLVGPWQVWFFWQGLVPRPTVKKKCLSTFWGTFAGNWELAKLRSLLAKFVAKEVSLRAGSMGLKSESFLTELVEWREWGGTSYSRIPATVELSKVPWPVAYGLALMKNVALGYLDLVLRRTLVVWPGAMRIVSVSNGLT